MVKSFYTKIASRLNIKGFGLIEVMISAMVLSISLLGIASIQSRSMALMIETNREEVAAGMRAQLYLFALRANQNNFIANFAPATWGANVENTGLCQVTMANSINMVGGTAGCTPEIFYQNFVRQWNNNLGETLPNGQGCVCFDLNGVNATNFNSRPIIMSIVTAWTNLAGEQGRAQDNHQVLTPEFIGNGIAIRSCAGGTCDPASFI